MSIFTYIVKKLTSTVLRVALVIAPSTGLAMMAPDTLRTDIYYEIGNAAYNDSLRSNAVAADKLQKTLSRVCVRSVNITSSASPEGSTAYNNELSVRRSHTALSLLGLNADSVELDIRSIGVDWAGLADRVAGSKTPMADSITDIILNTPEWVIRNDSVVDSRKKRLMDLRGGKPWFFMFDSIFPDLRVSRITIVYDRLVHAPSPVKPLPVKNTIIVDSPKSFNVTYPDDIYRHIKPHRPGLSLRSNLLFDAAAVPNIGLSANLGSGWSVAVDGHNADWRNSAHNRYWRVQGAELSVRKALTFTPQQSLNHWFLEIYAQIFRYNICLGKTGYLSGRSAARFFDYPTVGGGIGGGYSIALSPLLSLDFSLGLGYVCGQYQTYRIIDRHLVWQTTRQRHYLGLSRAGISLVWHLMKGGRRW